MTHNFILSTAGGFLEPLPERAQRELESRVPGAPIEAISRQYSFYLVRSKATDAQPPAREIKKAVGELERLVAKMLAVVEPISKNNLGSLIDYEAEVKGYPDTLGSLIKNLRVLKHALPLAARELPSGHAVNNRHVLVESLLPVLEQSGLPIDERPNGPLCQIVGIVLAAAGENPSNIVTIVSPVLDALKKTAKK